MKLTLVLLVACSSQPAYLPSSPIARCPSPPAASPVVASAPAQPESEPGRAGDLRAELARLDREIDALDNEIATFAPPAASRDAAIMETAEREPAIVRASLDGDLAGAPSEMRHIAALFYARRVKQLELERDLGPRMPEVIAGRKSIEWLRDAFERQRDVELAELHELRKTYSELRPGARPVDVRNARLRAEIVTYVSAAATGLEPSDAPAEIRIPVERWFDGEHRLADAGTELGPKHPEMVAAAALRDQAREDLERAIKATADELLAQIAAPVAATAAVDPSKIMRRVELAARARELRAELAAL